MNAKSLIAVSLASLAALGAGSAFAQSAVPAQNAWYVNQPASTLTRAEVRAEVLSARALGELRQDGEATTFDVAATPSSRGRAEVRAEAAQRVLSPLHFDLNIGG